MLSKTPFLAIFFLFICCSCKSKENLLSPLLEIAKTDLNISCLSSPNSFSINIATNSDTFTAISNVSWCSVETIVPSRTIQLSINENGDFTSRTANIEVKAGELKKTITLIQFGLKPEIIIKKKNFNLDFKAQTIAVELTTNVSLEVSSNVTWLKFQTLNKSSKIDVVYNIDADQLPEKSSTRTGIIWFKQQGTDFKDSVTIHQSITASNDYNPALASSFEKDKKIKILSASLNPSDKYQGGEDIYKSVDGLTSTLYHSPWKGFQANLPLVFEYFLDPADASIANYVVLHPRTSGINGIIKHATIWVSTAENDNYQQVGTIDVSSSNNPVIVNFAIPILNPRKIKMEVTDAYSQDPQYYVSLAEFECYESKSFASVTEDLKWFTDITFSELQPGVSLPDVAKIKNPFIQNIATYLMANKYSPEFRIQHYEPYRDVNDLAEELKMSAYSQFENITGIFFSKEEEVVLFVGKTNGENISLRVKDFGSSGDDFFYPLHEGINLLTMRGKGNGYISYYTAGYQSADPIKIHIASGKVNGFFDTNKHSNEDGNRLLDQAVSEIMDIRGNRVHLAYSVKALRSYSYSKLKELITAYDSIISIEQTMLGLKKYNRLPKNRMFGRVVWDGYMFADGIGAGFNENTMATIANPDNVMSNNWGIAHEFGHVNQVRPGMKWVGTTECTNNIYSAWVQYVFTPDNLRLEHENSGGTIGGRFNAFFKSALIEKQEWGIQAGPDKQYGADDKGVWAGDHFVKLVPLWQLQLFFHVAGEGNTWHRPYFWAEIFEKVRLTNENNLSQGQLQVNFMKNVCDATQYDLSDFFIQIGMLKIVDKMFDDYTKAQKTLTQAMVEETISYAGKYPKPETRFISYICGNNVETYKYKRKISGTYNSGISGTSIKQISHSSWKEVVAFETYSGETLTDITMVGTGSINNAFTNVTYPTNSTRMEAVGWDGTRILVTGKR